MTIRIRGAVLDEIGRAGPYRESRPLTIDELELAPPQAGEISVRIEAAGLCHSDLSVVDGNRVRPVPMLLGHEAAGRVETLGPGVTDLAIGDRIVMTFLPRCGACPGCATAGRRPCVPGSAANGAGQLLGGGVRLRRDGSAVLHHLGVSAFATHAVVDRRSVVKVDDDVPADVAALLGCAVLTGGGAVLNTAPPLPGQTVIVVGLGGVGMAAIMTALALDDVRVIGVDTLDAKLAEATRLGAHEAYTPANLVAAGVKAPLVVDATGSAAALEAAIEMTEAGGTTVTVGLPAPAARTSFSPTALVGEGRTIIGSYLGSAVPSRDIPAFAAMWRAGRLPVEKLVSARITLDDINDALDELAAGRAIRQVIEFGEAGDRT